MGMGIVDNSEFESALNDCITPVKESNGVVSPNPLGRPLGKLEVPDSLRKIIGETSELDSRQDALALAKSFNISPSSVSAYANGSTSTKSYDSPKPEILNHINRSKERTTKRARSVLNTALRNITTEKLELSKPEVLSNIAKNMSAIIKDMTPDVIQTEQSNKPSIIIYAPTMRPESSFEVITVND